MNATERKYTLDELCSIVDLKKRTARSYIHSGLVARPNGAGKGAFYTGKHLEQLLGVVKWRNAGVSLDRIREIMGGEVSPERPVPPPRRRSKGQVEVWTKMFLADGVELHVESGRARLKYEQVNALFKEVLKAFERTQEKELVS